MRNKAIINILAMVIATAVGHTALAEVDAAEIYCTIRDELHLNCQWVGKEARRSMTPEETAQFIDRSEVASYMSVRSRKGLERVFTVDPDAPQFRKLSDVKKIGSISEIAKAKLDLFADIEKKAVKISDDLDAQASSMELVKYDSSIGNDKAKRELRRMDKELITLRDSSAGPNQIFESGSGTDSTATFETKHVFSIGAGLAASNVVADANTQAGVANAVASYRYSWNPNWVSDLEARYSLVPTSVAYGPSNPSNNIGTSEVTLMTERCFDGAYSAWCPEIDVASYTLIGITTNNRSSAPTTRQFQSFTETFYGVGTHYRWKTNRASNYIRVAYLFGAQGTQMGGGKPSSEFVAVAMYNYERQIIANHGVIFQGGLEFFNAGSGGPSTQAAVSSATLVANALYKYSY